MELQTKFNVFIASPGDIKTERSIVREICESLNKSQFIKSFGILFEVTGWEDVFPSPGRPQEIINRLVAECDIFICIFHKRFGSQTGTEESGTLEEFLLAYDLWKKTTKPHIMFYFKEAKIQSLSDLQDPQLKKVLELKEKIKSNRLLLFNEFSTPDEFHNKLKDHLEKWIAENAALLAAKSKGKKKKTSDKSPVKTYQAIPEAYLNWIISNYGAMDVEKLYGKGEAFPLRLPEIFIPLYANEPVSKAEIKKGREIEEKRSPVDIEKIIARSEYLLIEGHAGSGKTTLLKHIAYYLAQKDNKSCKIEDTSERLPLLVLLKELNAFFKDPAIEEKNKQDAMDILAWYIEKKLKDILDSDIIVAFLKAKRAVILLDGLDELLPEYRDQVVNAFADLGIRYSGNKIVFTGRPHGIEGAAIKRLGDRYVKIFSLSMEQVNQFINRWFTYLYPGKAGIGDKNAQAMIGEIRTHSAIEQLIDNPLMLTAICILYHDQKELPGQRAELYKKFIDNMLYRRFQDSENVHAFLKDLAFNMHDKKVRGADKSFIIKILKKTYEKKDQETEKTYKIRIDETFNDIEPKCGLLKLEDGQYSFWHLTFQEFLTAQYLVDKSTDYSKAVAAYWVDDWYREVIELYIGYLSIENRSWAHRIIEGAIDEKAGVNYKKWMLASEALIDIQKGRRYPDVENKARGRMLDIINAAPEPKVLAQAGEALGWLGDTRDLKEFVRIEGGEYELEDIGKVKIESFEINKYPIINTWFEEFIKADGYKNNEYWSQEGIKWREHTKAEKPRFWDERKWRCPNSPVVGICWYEAYAFTRWLTVTMKDGYTYRVLREKEWQAAATGKEGRKYPWGNEWDKNKCNNEEIKIMKTSPVGIFKQGNTTEGVADLSGNVWEWTMSDYHSRVDLEDFGFDSEIQELWDNNKFDEYIHKLGEKDRQLPVLRGGSWNFQGENCRCAYRSRGNPDSRYYYIGFRCARTVTL